MERGTWNVHDAVREQPWLPNGPISLNVEWTMPGYEPRGPGTTSAATIVKGVR